MLVDFIQRIHPLPKEVLDEAITCFRQEEYPRGFYLLKQGRPCQYLWLLMNGAVRYFYTDSDGKEYNVWFSIDEDIVADASSMINQSPSYESIQLMEDSELYGISYSDLQRLLHKHHSFTLWYIKLIEKYYVTQIEDRIADLQFLTAKQRYEKLLKQFPQIGNRITLGHIASYLNVTQETLSRIRSGKL